MSQPSGADAVRRSVSPGSLKRKRGLADYTSSRRAQEASKTARNPNSASASANSHIPTGPSGAGKQYRSPASDELQRSDSGDLLQGVGSASSLTSAASSVFSHGSHAGAQNRAANGLTPLTTHSESSPSKPFSPRAAHSSADMSAPNGTQSAPAMPSSAANHSRNERTPMHLSPGKAKGYRAVFDPELASGLKREERKKATFIKKEFGLEVRHTFHILTA